MPDEYALFLIRALQTPRMYKGYIDTSLPESYTLHHNIASSMISNEDIEYIRPSDARRFGLSRSSLYNLIADGKIQCRLIRRPGFKRPMRLIKAQELREFIEGCIEK
jgi:hypothetical protein